MENLELGNYVSRIQSGDDEAFHEFYEKTKRQVFYNILSLVKSHETSEDILQDTYVLFLKSIDKVDSSNSILGYLMRLSKNLSIDFLRKHKEQHEYLDEFNGTEHKPLDKLSEEDLIKRIKTILKDYEFRVVIRHIYLDLTFKEIAKADKRPLGTVLYTYNRAIKKLREEMEYETR